MTKTKRTQIKTIYKTLHRKWKIEEHDPNEKAGVKLDAPEGQERNTIPTEKGGMKLDAPEG